MVEKNATLKWLDEHFEETMLIIFLLVITLLTGLQVLLRKVFNSPLTWSEEMCRYAFLWSGFLGVSYCLRHHCDIRVDTFVAFFPKRVQAVLTVLADLVCLALYGMFSHAACLIVYKSTVTQQISPALGLPSYILYAVPALAFVLAVVRGAANLRDDVRAIFKH